LLVQVQQGALEKPCVAKSYARLFWFIQKGGRRGYLFACAHQVAWYPTIPFAGRPEGPSYESPGQRPGEGVATTHALKGRTTVGVYRSSLPVFSTGLPYQRIPYAHHTPGVTGNLWGNLWVSTGPSPAPTGLFYRPLTSGVSSNAGVHHEGEQV
jgi:hypothetical protein